MTTGFPQEPRSNVLSSSACAGWVDASMPPPEGLTDALVAVDLRHGERPMLLSSGRR
ncbi:hypothetical protein JM654_14595 [Microbacterium oxydans]|nr:hypothetical protein [Microbacterium oxydans]